jgi:ubiquinone/menaquinone biosynthesis C-methylase UbiE
MNNKIQEDSFDHKAVNYEEYYNFLLNRSLDGGYERKADIISRNCPGLSNSVLEVGAGSGLLTFWLTQKISFSTYLGLDISSKMLEQAEKRFHGTEKPVSFQKQDVTNLDSIDKNTFDLVTGADIVHHLDQPVEALKEWNRITKINGKLVILESNIYNPVPLLYHIGDESEVRSYLNTDYNLKKWLLLAGWSDISVLPAPIFTPWKPKMFRPVYSLMDRSLVKIPYIRKLS